MVWKLTKCIGGLQSAAAVAVADAGVVAAGKVNSSSGTKADLSLRRLVLDRISDAQPELGVRFRFSELDVEGAQGPSS